MSRDIIEIKPQPFRPRDQKVDLRATAYNGRHPTLARLRSVLHTCGGFLLEDRNTSGMQTALRFEIPRRAVFDLYSGLLSSELELTRDSHLSLTGLCTLRRHHPLRGGNVSVQLELNFPDETSPDDLWTAIGFA